MRTDIGLKICNFEDIPHGECFIGIDEIDNLYFKVDGTRDIIMDNLHVNAVNLQTGEMVEVKPKTPSILIDCVVNSAERGEEESVSDKKAVYGCGSS